MQRQVPAKRQSAYVPIHKWYLQSRLITTLISTTPYEESTVHISNNSTLKDLLVLIPSHLQFLAVCYLLSLYFGVSEIEVRAYSIIMKQQTQIEHPLVLYNDYN